MPRPKKCRTVCRFPQTTTFAPAGWEDSGPAVILTVDEYESIRLIDKEGLSQEQCAQRMDIARTTVQMIYTSARKKLADFLVDGLPLRIQGGDYQLCSGDAARCGCTDCFQSTLPDTKPKGETIMRIAVTYENGQIFQHFGHTQQFKLYDVENGQILSTEVVDTSGSGHGALAGLLKALNVDALICGGIGGGAQAALASAGIRLYGGVSGSADQAAAALAAGSLNFDPDVRCGHHGEHHHGGSCGDHGCGSHSCH